MSRATERRRRSEFDVLRLARQSAAAVLILLAAGTGLAAGILGTTALVSLTLIAAMAGVAVGITHWTGRLVVRVLGLIAGIAAVAALPLLLQDHSGAARVCLLAAGALAGVSFVMSFGPGGGSSRARS